MNYRIMQLSDWALHLLKNKQNGVIHSVYRKTINMNIDGSLLALQACHSPMSPLSLLSNLDDETMQGLHIVPGMPVTIDSDSVRIGSCAFYYDSAERFSCELKTVLQSSDIQTLKKRLETVLMSAQTGGFDLIFQSYRDPSVDLPSLILEGARNYLSQAYYFIQHRNDTSASAFLSRLIGLGIGLTPSGDDFLCGVLAGLILSGASHSHFAEILKKEIADSLSNTNDISCAFLQCALNDRFSRAVHSLVELPEVSKILSTFREIGHSSGIDTLCGIYFALNL